MFGGHERRMVHTDEPPARPRAAASDDTGVASVAFFVDGSAIGNAVTAAPFATFWNSASVADGVHSLTAVAHDAAGNASTSTAAIVSTANAGVQAFPLRLAGAQRYLVDQSNRPFLVHGDAAWSLISGLSNAAATRGSSVLDSTGSLSSRSDCTTNWILSSNGSTV